MPCVIWESNMEMFMAGGPKFTVWLTCPDISSPKLSSCRGRSHTWKARDAKRKPHSSWV